MFSNFFWIFAVTGFVAQIVCYVYGRNALVRVLPMLIMAGIIVLTLIASLSGLLTLVLVVVELMILGVTALGYLLCKLVLFTKK